MFAFSLLGRRRLFAVVDGFCFFIRSIVDSAVPCALLSESRRVLARCKTESNSFFFMVVLLFLHYVLWLPPPSSSSSNVVVSTPCFLVQDTVGVCGCTFFGSDIAFAPSCDWLAVNTLQHISFSASKPPAPLHHLFLCSFFLR